MPMHGNIAAEQLYVLLLLNCRKTYYDHFNQLAYFTTYIHHTS